MDAEPAPVYSLFQKDRTMVKSALAAVRETFTEFFGEGPFQLAAALSYFTLLSLAPLLVVIVSVAGLAFGREAVEGRIVTEIGGMVGTEGAQLIQTVLRNAAEPRRGTLSLLIGLGTLLLGATTVFLQLQTALNQIWEVKAKPRRNAIWDFVRDRLLSLALVVGVGFLLLVSLLVSAGLSAVGTWVESRFPEWGLLQAVNQVFSFAVITLMMAVIYRYLPDARIPWRPVWWGAVVTALLFTAGKYLIGLYLGRASIGSAYGAAGSVVVFMVWVYYASLIVFLGAEITQVHARRSGTWTPPVAYAVPAPERGDGNSPAVRPPA